MNIYTAINNVMSGVGVISKDKTNTKQGFKYRGIDDVMNALQPLLIKNKIFVMPEVLEQTREERQAQSGNILLYSILKMKYTFFADDGSCVYAIVVGEGMDSGDKASNKAMAIAFKYACFQVFCIPTEEMPDPDGDTPEPIPKQNPKIPTPKDDLDKKILKCSSCNKEITVAEHDYSVSKFKKPLCRACQK